MAPIGEAHFPPLDKCFRGQQQLISWKTLYVALSRLDHGAESASLRQYLADPHTIQILAHAFSPFQKPTSQTKSNFETQTSAVNTDTSAQTPYDIKQIREDTLWLSKQDNIDEVSALRIVLLEWQVRPATQLLQGTSEDQRVDGGRIGDAGSLRTSIFDHGSSLYKSSVAADKESSTQPQENIVRRRRILETYLSERRYILKCSEYLIFIALFTSDVTGRTPHGQEEDHSLWLKEAGANIVSSWISHNNESTSRKHPVVEAVDALRLRLESVTKGSGWLSDEGMQEDIELAFARSQILESIHIMQITLSFLLSSVDLLKSTAVLSWFRFMKDTEFYDGVQLPHTFQTAFGIPLVSLPALISLIILNLPTALKILGKTANTVVATASSEAHAPYILETATVNEINDILRLFAAMKPASPAAMAWAVILNNLRDTAQSTRDSREARQSIRAADRYNAVDSPDNDISERPPSIKPFSSLQRRSSTGSDASQQSTLLEEISDTIAYAVVDGGDPVAFLAGNAVGKGSVFEVVTAIATEYCTPFGFEHDGRSGRNIRGALFDLIRASAEFVDYSPSLMTATLAVLTGSERFWENLDRPSALKGTEPAALFLQDKLLTHKLYLTSIAHFPYESLPFLELCRALAFANDGNDGGAPALWSLLEEVDTFTCPLPSKDFQSYRAAHMQEEADLIELTEDLNVLAGLVELGNFSSNRTGRTSRALTKAEDSSLLHTICSGTGGRLMNDKKPFVVAWNQPYSVLAYMGKLLQCASTAGDVDNNSSYFLSSDIVGEVIGLITNMLAAATKISSDTHGSTTALESAQTILGFFSAGMSRNHDAVSVILDVFEQELFKSRKTSEDFESMEILVYGVQYMSALLRVMPDRVWPFLGRSGLLDIGNNGGQMKTVVATQEMITGHYDFLLGCIRLFDSLVTDAITHAVSRKTPTKALSRFGSVQPTGAGISQRTMEKVLLSLTQIMIEVFEGTTKWRFVEQSDRMEINSRLNSVFTRILRCCFGVSNDSSRSQNLASALLPANDYIVDVFLSKSNTDVIVSPLLQILEEGTTTRITTLPVRGLQYWTKQVKAVLDLCNTLVRVNTLMQRSISYLGDQMFNAAPLLVKLYAVHEEYRLPVIELLDSLMRSSAAVSQQPPSLLGHLGHAASNHFLTVLSAFDQPLNDSRLSTAIWRFLSAIVSKRQQWFAIFVLTGTTPRDSFKEKAVSPAPTTGQSEPLLNVALDALSHIDKLDPRKALCMLEFVALAADFWPWVLGIMEKHGQFLKGISEYAAHIGSMASATREKSYKTSADYNSIQMASLVADILSMYIRHTQEMGNQKFAKGLVPHLTYLIKNAISAPSYNNSLHANLRRNFESKFPGWDITEFKRTTLVEVPLGDSYFYDLELAHEMLSYEPAWAGRKGDDGFAEEMRRANFNLSVVESQVNLFHSWKSLLIELSGPLISEPKFQRIMGTAAIDCLKANAENTLPEAVFERLALSRVTLAFTLSQRLLEAKSTQPDALNILPAAWTLVRVYNTNVGAALDGDGADYYRMLLKILYLSLQIHSSSTTPSDLDQSQSRATANSPTAESSANIALEIISVTVAQGFRSLTVLLHDDPKVIHPSDFALLTAILRSALAIADVTRNTAHLLNAFSDSQTARCASTLLSWSDQIVTSGDPVYGELSILFLLEMSSVPSLAESLAVEGVLSQMLGTNLVRLLQIRDFGPFSQPSRMYSIWSKAILPLLLNLLHSVGPPLAAEIAGTLNGFPHQLERASGVFTTTPLTSNNDPNRDHITLGSASEAVTLSLITTILQTYREASSSVGIVGSAIEQIQWDRTQVKEEAEACLERRVALRDRIVATNEREEVWSRAKPEDEKASGAESRLEEKVVEEMRTVVGILSGHSD